MFLTTIKTATKTRQVVKINRLVYEQVRLHGRFNPGPDISQDLGLISQNRDGQTSQKSMQITLHSMVFKFYAI